MGTDSGRDTLHRLSDNLHTPMETISTMKNTIALGIRCELDTHHQKLQLTIPPDVTPDKLRKWNEANRAYVWSKLLKDKVKVITI